MDESRVSDLMLPIEENARISGEATIQEALVALSKAQLGLTQDRHHLRAILVLDATGNVVGKLSHWDILRSLEPRLIGEQDRESLLRAGISEGLVG